MDQHETPIAALGLSRLAENSLRREGIDTVSQLTLCTPADLRRIRNMGATSIAAVQRALVREGASLAGVCPACSRELLGNAGLL